MAEQNEKRKLTIDEQIQDMMNKNIKFELYSEKDAKNFLKYNNYYFKLKSYAKNYNINPQNQKYFQLDFAYLVELSKLDMYIRKIILELSLDVEHYLKVRLMNDLSNNPEEDGYNIVELFFQSYPTAENDIRSKADKYTFCSDLAEKHLDECREPKELAVWNIVEILSFGNFIELYKLYYQIYPSFNYSDYLKSIKFIRNAAAHNNCILSSLRKSNSLKKFNKTRKLTNILGKIPDFRELNNMDAMMGKPVIHDFVALLFVYNDVMKVSATKKIRNKKMDEIYHLFCDTEGRIRKNAAYFEKNTYIRDAYLFICNIIGYINRKNRNPKHTNFLT